MWRRFIDQGGLWVIAQSGLMILVLASGPLGRGSGGPSGATAAAWVLFALGAGLGLGGAWSLKGNRTIFPKPNAQGWLVQHGVYRWVRHPLYACLMLLGAGWGLLWWSWPAAALGLMLSIFLNAKAAREEAWLRAKYPGYDAYSQRVKRFIPGLI